MKHEARRQPDPPKIDPPLPNLSGDDVRWVRRDASGKVTNWGHMHRDALKRQIAAGDKIEEVDADTWQEPAPDASDLALQTQYAIAGALERSDRYFTADALDNVSAAEQAQWRAYRKALRAANKLKTGTEILAAVPPDPKGIDQAAHLRPGKP